MTNIKTVFTGVAVVLMVMTTSVVYAETNTTNTTSETTEEALVRLEKQISELIKLIALLQKQIGLRSTTVKQYDESSNYSPYRLSENLYLGSKSEEVRWLQDFLSAHYSSFYPEKEVTGYYGTMTESAVKRFQEKYGIEAVGEVGPQTRAKINSLMDAKSYKYKSYTEKSSSKNTVSTVKSDVDSIDLEYLGDGEITWDVDGVSSKGFKIVWSMNESPTYPTRSGDKYIYLSSKSADKATVYAFDKEGTYYVRVCEYLGGKCGKYSNEIEVDLDASSSDKDDGDDEESVVDSIDLKHNGDGEISWNVEGVSSHGFKVVWSMNENPTYPTRSGDKYLYLSDKDADEATVYAFDEDGTYYVRVCEYLGGKCGKYSNEIEVDLD